MVAFSVLVAHVYHKDTHGSIKLQPRYYKRYFHDFQTKYVLQGCNYQLHSYHSPTVVAIYPNLDSVQHIKLYLGKKEQIHNLYTRNFSNAITLALPRKFSRHATSDLRVDRHYFTYASSIGYTSYNYFSTSILLLQRSVLNQRKFVNDEKIQLSRYQLKLRNMLVQLP